MCTKKIIVAFLKNHPEALSPAYAGILDNGGEALEAIMHQRAEIEPSEFIAGERLEDFEAFKDWWEG